MDWSAFWQKCLNILEVIGISLLKLLGVFILGIILIKVVIILAKKILTKFKIDSTAQKFLITTSKFVLYVILFLAMAQVINIPMTGFVALISAGGLAVSLALQGSLSNLANGIVIISNKPFKEGDFVKIDDIEGTVKEIKMQYTILSSIDNKEISLPNKKVVESDIINYNKLGTRKVVINFELNEYSDIDKAKLIINNVLKSSDKIFLNPEPFVAFDSLSNGVVKLYSSAWCLSQDYWDVYYYILDHGYNELKREKVKLARNLLDVKLVDEPKKVIREKMLPVRSKNAPVSYKTKSEEKGFEVIINNFAKKKHKSKTKEVKKP